MNLLNAIFFALLVAMMTSCGSSAKLSGGQASSAAQLSDEEQRRYDYYYMEYVRLSGDGDHTGAYNMLEHCLAINPSAPSALYAMSDYYLYLGRYDESQRFLEMAVDGAPDNYWYAQALVTLYQRYNMKDESVALLEKMEKRFPERQEILYALYSAYSDSGNDKKMVETLDKIESIVGRNEQLTMEKSNAYLRSGDKKKALAEMEGLVAEYPQDSRYKVLLGSLYEQIDESDEAYSIYQGVLSAEPDNALALMAMLGYYEKNGSAELYEKQLNDVLSSKTVDAEGKRSILLNRVAYIENSKQDSTKAIALFDRTIESENYDTETLQLYAQYLWEKKMQKESQPLLEKVLQAEPDNKMARLMLLQLAVNGEDYALVESVCKAGVDELPDVLEFYLYLALAYNHDGRTDDALSAINLGIEHVDGKTDKALASDLYSMQGDLYHTKNMPVEAYSAYDTALSYNSESVAVLNNYAYYLSVDNRDLDKAEEMSYKTIKAEPNNSTYLDTYAWILFMKGRYTEARTYIDQALKNIDDASGVVKEHCGDIYYMNGDVDEAVKYWKQSLDEGNDSKTLKEKIKRKRYIAE